MAELAEFVELRDGYELEVAEHGLVFPDFQDEYEVVEDSAAIGEMEAFIEERRQAIAVYEEARAAVAAPRGLATTVGLNELPEPGLTLLEAHRALNDNDPARTIELAEQVHLQLAFASVVGQDRIDDVVAGAYGLLGVLAVALLWLVVSLLRSRRSLRVDRSEPGERQDDESADLPPRDAVAMDVMDPDSNSPTGHLADHLTETRTADGVDIGEWPVEPIEDPSPEAV